MLPLFLFADAHISSQQYNTSGSDQCRSLALVREHHLGPGQPLFGHVQGLEVSDDFFLITAVANSRESGFLYLYPRSGRERRLPRQQYDLWKLARERAPSCGPLNTGRLNHPSGLHLVGDRLHVAIAPSANRGPSCVMTLALHDLSAPQVVRAFRVEEHIGAVVQVRDDVLIGFNWGSADYWWLAEDGSARRLPVREERAARVAELLHIQDCDRDGPRVLCGHSNDQDNLVKIYDAAAFRGEATTLKPRIILAPPFGSQHGGTHEGLAWHEGRLFLLPDDGDEVGVSVYEFACAAARPEYSQP